MSGKHDPFGWSKRLHPRLFIPGPTEVRPEVLEAQGELMIGHRTPELEALFARVQAQARQLFFTNSRVYITASSGMGLQEAAIRNGVRERVICFVNGAFSQRWADVAEGCGKQVARVEVEWGQPITPELVAEALREHGPADAITVVHNETSTGVISPVDRIAAAVHDVSPDTLIFVDAVSSFAGTPIYFDEWGLDVCLTSSQKALACPPGLALGAVSDRVLERAKSVSGRGWYFDFLLLEKYLQRNTTPATPAISLLRALHTQLTYILDVEGVEARFARHRQLAEMTWAWVQSRGFDFFAAEGYRSPTVTAVTNTRNVDVDALNAFLKARGMVISNGYGPLKGRTFRIAHMGDTTVEEMQYLLDTIDEFLVRSS